MASARNTIKKICPRFLISPARKTLSECKDIRLKLDMILFPHKMTRYCSCCGMRFRSFFAWDYQNYPHIFDPSRYNHTRQDVICPNCKSFPRHRILALWGEKHMDLLRSAKILYFAPDNSELIWMKRNGVSCITADLYRQNTDLKLDIQATGLPDESFDVIFCNHVLEHVDDFRMALKEMFRILRPGGSFICSFPMDPSIEFFDEDLSLQTDKERISRFGQSDHKRVFGMNADKFLTEAGFTVETIRGEDYPESILPVVGPANYDMNRLFHCIKKTCHQDL